jgi:hypothetical protein
MQYYSGNYGRRYCEKYNNCDRERESVDGRVLLLAFATERDTNRHYSFPIFGDTTWRPDKVCDHFMLFAGLNQTAASRASQVAFGVALGVAFRVAFLFACQQIFSSTIRPRPTSAKVSSWVASNALRSRHPQPDDPESAKCQNRGHHGESGGQPK